MANGFDVIVVGSGHNGLITAAYLAKAGLHVAVFERRRDIGGAVCTRGDIFPGYQIDVGSSAHVMIHQTPVIRDLDLASYGLEYIEMDPFGYYPLLGEGRSFYFYRDVIKTCESIAAISSRDAEAYQKFADEWGRLNQRVFEVFLKPPTPFNLARSFMGGSLGGRNRMDMIRKLMGPYGQLVTETFEHEAVRSAIIWLAAQSGPPPSEPASGDFAGWHPMYHHSGMKRARGGSGALTQALKQRILAAGGSVFDNTPVDAIRTDGTGRVTHVVLENGETYAARAIVAACHVHITFARLLRDAPVGAALRRRVSEVRVGNGFGMVVRCAMSGLPQYPGEPADENGVSPAHRGLQLLCPSRLYLENAYADYRRGRPPENPVPLVMTFSALDPSIAPPGKHVMFVWGQYHPYELADGGSWDDLAEREADKLLAVVDRYAPGTSGKVLDRYIQTPLEIERLHAMPRGNVMHVEMSLDQMFCFRPTPELAGYRVPGLRGMYLTGASMHPGGGVWGAAGYNAARVVLNDRRRWR